jgi:hypothetical protein
MDEKRARSAADATTMRPLPHSRRSRVFLAVLAVLLLGLYASHQWYAVQAMPTMVAHTSFYPLMGDEHSEELPMDAKGGLVPLEAHIISKCPDTRVSTLHPGAMCLEKDTT